MALTRFGFIVTGDDFVQWTGTEHFRMKVVGVKSPEQGIQLIELCGGFSPVWAGKIIEAIDYAVPVGWWPTVPSPSAGCTGYSRSAGPRRARCAAAR